MCPDIETFAPLIGATFGAGDVLEPGDEFDALPAEIRPTDLRVRLADRALRQPGGGHAGVAVAHVPAVAAGNEPPPRARRDR